MVLVLVGTRGPGLLYPRLPTQPVSQVDRHAHFTDTHRHTHTDRHAHRQTHTQTQTHRMESVRATQADRHAKTHDRYRHTRPGMQTHRQILTCRPTQRHARTYPPQFALSPHPLGASPPLGPLGLVSPNFAVTIPYGPASANLRTVISARTSAYSNSERDTDAYVDTHVPQHTCGCPTAYA